MALGLTPTQLTRLRKKLRKEERSRAFKARGVEPPKSVEAEYFRALKGIVRKLERQVNRQLLPELKALEPDYIRDSPGSINRYVAGIITDIEQEVVVIEATRAKIVARMARSVESFNRNVFVKEINEAVGVSLRGVIKKEGVETFVEESIEENIGLIKTIPEQYHSKLRTKIAEGIDQGDDYFSIRKDILALGQSTVKRAKLIARDQVAKLNAAITQKRQEKVGITHYFWRTADDERVRPTHEAHEGKRYAWADPPADTGHPGHDIQCRCSAEPDLSGVLGLA